MTTEVIQPLIKAIAIDVTGYYNQLPPGIAGVLDVYVYDDNIDTYLCSAEKTICLWKVYSTWVAWEGQDYDDQTREELEEFVAVASMYDEDVIYMSRASIERIVKETPQLADTYGPCGPVLTSDDTFQEISRELIEEALDYYRGNPPW